MTTREYTRGEDDEVTLVEVTRPCIACGLTFRQWVGRGGRAIVFCPRCSKAPRAERRAALHRVTHEEGLGP